MTQHVAAEALLHSENVLLATDPGPVHATDGHATATHATAQGRSIAWRASGKVRDIYDVCHDLQTDQAGHGQLLFVATDRLSAFDVILENVRGVACWTDGDGVATDMTLRTYRACQVVERF